MFYKDLTLYFHISFLLLYVDFNNFNLMNFRLKSLILKLNT